MIENPLRATLLALAFGLFAWVVPAAEPPRTDEDPSAEAIVAAADKVRNPSQPFRMTSTLVDYIDGKPQSRTALEVYSREDAANGKFSNLVRYVDPPRDTGKLVLMDSANLWFYDPSSKASVRISPQQRLTGQASDGDIMTVNLSRDYKATVQAVESVKDADRQERECWRLDMTATTEDATYGRIEYWVEKGSFRPVKGRFYADSGRLLKIAYYHKYSDALGMARPSEIILIDAVSPSLATTVTFSDYRATAIPATWFQRDFLPRVPIE